MTAQLSRQMLLLMHNGDDPGAFETFGALTAKSMTLGGEAVNVTDDESISATTAGKLIRELVAGGVNALDVSGDFRLKDKQVHRDAVELKMSASPIRDFQIFVPGIGTFEGPMHINELKFDGQDSGGDSTGSISLASAGDFTFAASS